MSSFPVFRLTPLAAAALLVLAGCAADPASEEPITLAPGNYFVTSAQGPEGGSDIDPSGSLDENICVFPDEVADFPKAFTRAYVPGSSSCTLNAWAREGNAIHGLSSCPMSLDGFTFDRKFEGVVSTGRIEVVGRNKVNMSDSLRAAADPAAVQAFEREMAPAGELVMRWTAVRTGDCEKLAMPFGDRL